MAERGCEPSIRCTHAALRCGSSFFLPRKRSGGRAAKSNPIVYSTRCAARSSWRSSALNRRSRFHIRRMDSEQALSYQLPEEFREILTK